MPKKTVSDLAANQYVSIHKMAMPDREVLQIWIEIERREAARNSASYAHMTVDELRSRGILRTGAEVFAENQRRGDRAGISQLKVALGPEAWMVVSSDAAEAGWGPFLYDIAMELATLKNAGLRSDGKTVSPEALRVWDYYCSNRSDVTKVKLPNVLAPKLRDESLQFMYQRTPDTAVQELKRLSKWKEILVIHE